MDRKPRKFQPQAAELESKLLLSVAPTSAPADAEMSILAVRSGSTPATATTDIVLGQYHAAEDHRVTDAPYRVKFAGSGKVDTLGKAKMAGELFLGGFRRPDAPQVTGTLTLSNARGAVKLELSGDGDAFGDVPNGQFATTATVVKATGAYRGFQRTGTVTVDFGPNQVHAKDPSTIGGTVVTMLSLKPLVK